MKRIFKNAYKDEHGNFVLEDEITPWQPLKIQKLDHNAVVPEYAYDGESVGLDLVATSCTYIAEKDCFCYETGLAIELEKDEVGFICPNSRNRNTDYYVPNSPGIDDPGYRGPLTLNYKNRVPRYISRILHSLEDIFNKLSLYCYEEKIKDLDIAMGAPYKVGDVVGQLIICKVQRKKLIVVNKLSPSKRMTGGHGSTIKK